MFGFCVDAGIGVGLDRLSAVEVGAGVELGEGLAEGLVVGDGEGVGGIDIFGIDGAWGSGAVRKGIKLAELGSVWPIVCWLVVPHQLNVKFPLNVYWKLLTRLL